MGVDEGIAVPDDMAVAEAGRDPEGEADTQLEIEAERDVDKVAVGLALTLAERCALRDACEPEALAVAPMPSLGDDRALTEDVGVARPESVSVVHTVTESVPVTEALMARLPLRSGEKLTDAVALEVPKSGEAVMEGVPL